MDRDGTITFRDTPMFLSAMTLCARHDMQEGQKVEIKAVSGLAQKGTN